VMSSQDSQRREDKREKEREKRPAERKDGGLGVGREKKISIKNPDLDIPRLECELDRNCCSGEKGGRNTRLYNGVTRNKKKKIKNVRITHCSCRNNADTRDKSEKRVSILRFHKCGGRQHANEKKTRGGSWKRNLSSRRTLDVSDGGETVLMRERRRRNKVGKKKKVAGDPSGRSRRKFGHTKKKVVKEVRQM